MSGSSHMNHHDGHDTARSRADSSDVSFRKIFIGGLSYSTDEEKLRKYFKAYGTVQDAVVMKDPISKRSRGFGFITFTDVAAVDCTLAKEPHMIDSRKVEAKRAVPRAEISKIDGKTSSGGATAKSTVTMNPQGKIISTQVPIQATGSYDSSHGKSLEGDGKSGAEDYAYNKIFVGGLHYDTRDAEFRSYFEKYGKVVSAEVMFNRETHKSRGFGFIVFETEQTAVKVAGEKDHIINDKAVEVKRAIPRSKLPPSTSSSGGGSAVMSSNADGIAANSLKMVLNGSVDSSIGSSPSAVNASSIAAASIPRTDMRRAVTTGAVKSIRTPAAPAQRSVSGNTTSYAAALKLGNNSFSPGTINDASNASIAAGKPLNKSDVPISAVSSDIPRSTLLRPNKSPGGAPFELDNSDRNRSFSEPNVFGSAFNYASKVSSLNILHGQTSSQTVVGDSQSNVSLSNSFQSLVTLGGTAIDLNSIGSNTNSRGTSRANSIYTLGDTPTSNNNTNNASPALSYHTSLPTYSVQNSTAGHLPIDHENTNKAHNVIRSRSGSEQTRSTPDRVSIDNTLNIQNENNGNGVNSSGGVGDAGYSSSSRSSADEYKERKSGGRSSSDSGGSLAGIDWLSSPIVNPLDDEALVGRSSGADLNLGMLPPPAQFNSAANNPSLSLNTHTNDIGGTQQPSTQHLFGTVPTLDAWASVVSASDKNNHHFQQLPPYSQANFGYSPQMHPGFNYQSPLQQQPQLYGGFQGYQTQDGAPTSLAFMNDQQTQQQIFFQQQQQQHQEQHYQQQQQPPSNFNPQSFGQSHQNQEQSQSLDQSGDSVSSERDHANSIFRQEELRLDNLNKDANIKNGNI